MCQTMRHESTEPLAEERGNAVMLGPEGPESPPGPWGDGAGRRWGEWGAAAVGFTSSELKSGEPMACQLSEQQAHLGTGSQGALMCRPWVPVSPQTRPEGPRRQVFPTLGSRPDPTGLLPLRSLEEVPEVDQKRFPFPINLK